MDLTLAAGLAALALIDSTSFGTLLIPVWLLLAPGRVRAGRILVYLGAVAAFYFAVGMAIVLGATAFLPEITAALDTDAAMWAQLALGVALFAVSFRFDAKRRKEGGGRIGRWRERAMGTEEPGGGTGTRTRTGSIASLIGLALAAASVEVATMLPYLAAIGMVTAAGLGAAGTTLTMAGYCLVMIAPALLLMTARLVARRAVEPLLVRVNDWMAKHAAGATGWILGILGFLLARDAAMRLGLLEALLNR
ncbi:GAP family protein [Glycomyces paridis]|uniref:GAP family protein n=1 Tax=Glycomyces paridis TaxID=2126555 RepID=A0A4S8PGP4_9ACTN|nr:GAP family protein [Glycomyces paridis]THV29081.1 hypothetical protein E9998_10065 [Glycomyces paridis]